MLVACHHAREVSTATLPRAAYSHYLAGKLALYRNDPATAADELALAAAEAPDQPMIAVELARALVKAKRVPAARDVLAKARAGWPDHEQVWLASGDVLAADAPADAVGMYRRAIELAPDDERGYLGLARVQNAHADARGAEATLRQLVAKVPASIDGHYRLAQRLAANGDMTTASRELRAVLERDPDHIDARIDLARALRRAGKLDEAIAQTRSAFDRAGQPADIAEELFWLLCEADDRQAAIDLLTLLDDERSDAELLATVARLDLGLGRIDEAAAIGAKLGKLDEGVDLALLIKINTDIARRDLTAAFADAHAVPATSRVAVTAHRLAAEASLAAGDPQRALDVLALDVTAEHQPPDEARLTYAVALADAGRDGEAREVLAKLEPMVRARYEDHLHHTPQALALVEPYLSAHPDDVTALDLAGYLLVEAKLRLPDAERYLRHARELAPGDPAVLDSWGWLLLAQGKTTDAIRALDHASRFSPLEPEIMLHLATARVAGRDPKAAAALLDRAKALRPSPDVARRIDALRVTIKP